MMLQIEQSVDKNGSPLGPDGILHNESIGSDQNAIVLYRLTNKHSIKRVSMERGQLVEMEDRAFVERQSDNPMLFALFSDEALECARQRKPSKRVLDGEFPDGHRAE